MFPFYEIILRIFNVMSEADFCLKRNVMLMVKITYTLGYINYIFLLKIMDYGFETLEGIV